MSELDKDKVLEDFSKAYQASEGKKPKVEANNGWYSVDGGKNMRLAQLDEWTDELKKGAKGKSSSDSKAKASSKPAPKKTVKSGSKAKSSNKADSKKPTKSTSKSKNSGKSKSNSSNAGQTPAELWKQRLADQAHDCRLPRGVE